jgi:ABC-type thiamine transport system substrate-binding protein
MAGKLSTLVIADQSGKEVYRGKLKFVDMSDSDTTVYDNNATPDKFFKELEPGNEVIEAIQREKQKGVKMLFVNILDTGDEVYNAAMNKYKVKGAKLMLR